MDSSRTNPRLSFSERSLDMFSRIDSKVNISDMKDKDEYEERDDENVLTEKDLQTLQASFNKLDKRNTGSIKPAEIVDVFRFSGQNPTNDEINKMVQEADEPGTGMLMFTEMIPIIEKYWRNYENYTDELKEACLAFDRKDTGIMVFDDMKEILMKYGEPFDEDELELFESSVNVSDGKIIVDDFIKLMSPLATETKKKKKGGKKGKGKKGASPKRK